MIPRSNALAQHTVVRQPLSLWPWTIRSGKVIAIPESGSVAHVKENAVAFSLTLTPQELQTLDAANPMSAR